MIEAVRTDLYRVPLPITLTDSTHGSMPDFELVTVRLRDDGGCEGVGYTYTVGTAGAAVAVLIDRDLVPVLQGADPDAIERRWQDMWWRLHYAGRGGPASSAVSAVDIALWDLAARRAGAPLWRHLGGFDPHVPVYAGGIDLQLPIDALLDQADGFLEAGFRAVKMKVGRPELREDLARVSRMREHLGEDFPLMVDANMRWSVPEATRAARALADLDLVWLEEPTIPDDVRGLAHVRNQGIPIAAGENLHTLYEFRELLAAGAVDYPEPDVTNCGGVTVFRKVAAMTEAGNLPLTSHGAHDVTVHLLAAAPHRTYMESHGFGLDRFLAEPLAIRDGIAVAPDRPGHGVDLDWAALERHRG